MIPNSDRKPLAVYYDAVKSVILNKQHPISGLLPASTAITRHGNYTDAWVRDNVYSILAVWGLWLAFARHEPDGSKTRELRFSCIHLMRGLLRAMMRQSHKVEAFKSSLALHDALHAKYDTSTGTPVVGDHDWGHLQIDATSLFLLMTAQMISSGLPIIQSESEVDFVQNLVYYIERAYRIADYGIWERGEKSNIGYVELNASSLGMALAALEAMNNFNLFGGDDPAATIHVIPDNLAMARTTLHALLPRESGTKETDAALLSIIGYPAFAIKNRKKRRKTLEKLRSSLRGQYGYKRFLRDGHQTAIEDPSRHYYEPEELKQFENIESEWPLFFTYEYLNAHFANDRERSVEFRKMIGRILVEQGADGLVPELYYVPSEAVDEERRNPGSQTREPNENIPLTWAQSLLILGDLLSDQHIRRRDIDPLGRHQMSQIKDHPPVQVLLWAGDQLVKDKMRQLGILAEIPSNQHGIAIKMPEVLAQHYAHFGTNRALNLTGRPIRRMRTLATSRLYEVQGQTFSTLSGAFLRRDFYFGYDIKFLVQRFKNTMRYIQANWQQEKAPVVSILLEQDHFKENPEELIALLQQMAAGDCASVPVKMVRVDAVQLNAEVVELPPLPDDSLEEPPIKEGHEMILRVDGEQKPLAELEEIVLENETNTDPLTEILRSSGNLFEHIEAIANLSSHFGLGYEIEIGTRRVSLRVLLEDIYFQSGKLRIWSILRQASAMLEKVDIQLNESVLLLLANQKYIQIGKAYSEESLIIRPIPLTQLLDIIRNYCHDDIRDRVLTQEILIYLGQLIKSEPHLFEDILTIRVSYLILLLTGVVARREKITQEDAFDWLMHQPPSYIQESLKRIMKQYLTAGSILKNLESLNNTFSGKELRFSEASDAPMINSAEDSWMVWRKSIGTINREPDQFYENIWRILERASGIIIGDKLDRRNRLKSSIILSDMTPGEKAFAWRLESLLNKISAPEYRQLTVEALMVISEIAEQNPELRIDDYIVVDVVIGHAVRIAFIDQNPALSDTYQDHKPDAWTQFYARPPQETRHFIVEAIKYLLQYQNEQIAIVPEFA